MPEETQLQGPERINLLIPRRARTGRRSKVSSPLFCTSALLGAQPDAPNCPLPAFPAPFPLVLLPGRWLAASRARAGPCGIDGFSLPHPSPSHPVHPAQPPACPRAPARPFCRRCRGRDNISATVNLQQKGCPSLRRMFKDRGLN